MQEHRTRAVVTALLVVAVAAVLLVSGLWQMRQMSMDMIPDFLPLTVEVKTEALGLSAAAIERLRGVLRVWVMTSAALAPRKY